MMQKESLKELYVNELKDLYNAEIQLVKALPTMAKASSNAELRQGFEEHLRQTSEHVSLLGQTLEEEKQTDEKLSRLAEQINSHARQGTEEETESRKLFKQRTK